MIPWIFAAAAAAYLFMSGKEKTAAKWPDIASNAPLSLEFPRPSSRANGRLATAALVVAVAAIAWAAGKANSPTELPPAPPDAPNRLDLRGVWVGESAASDAAITAALLGELADIVEWDGSQKSPRLSTGSAIHDLRTASREIRCRGNKIGDRQPAARDKIKAYLDAAAGTEGGPLSPDARSRWVSAYREVSRAAAESVGGDSPLPEAGMFSEPLVLAVAAAAAGLVFLAWGRQP